MNILIGVFYIFLGLVMGAFTIAFGWSFIAKELSRGGGSGVVIIQHSDGSGEVRVETPGNEGASHDR